MLPAIEYEWKFGFVLIWIILSLTSKILSAIIKKYCRWPDSNAVVAFANVLADLRATYQIWIMSKTYGSTNWGCLAAISDDGINPPNGQ